MDQKRVRTDALADQYAAAVRDAQGRVILSVAEMEILVTLATRAASLKTGGGA